VRRSLTPSASSMGEARSNAKRTQGDRPWTGISTSISRGTVSPLVLQGTCWRRSSLSAVRKFCGSLSIDAVTGGDTERAESLEEVIERRVRHKSLMEADQGSGKSSSLGVRLFGWSHGALVALLATAKNSCLFPRVACFCPAGLVERSPGEVVLSHLLGSIVSSWKALLRCDGTATRLLERGRNVRAAAAHDLVRGSSFQRVLDGMRSASLKVVGKGTSMMARWSSYSEKTIR